jgi:hypothetical protein
LWRRIGVDMSVILLRRIRAVLLRALCVGLREYER